MSVVAENRTFVSTALVDRKAEVTGRTLKLEQ
jgi:hypothetical protein